MIAGLLKPDKGRILVEDNDINGKDYDRKNAAAAGRRGVPISRISVV